MYKELLKLLLAFVILFGIVAAVLRIFFVDVVVISDDRMAPTLLAGEEAFMWRGADTDYGRMMVCSNPTVAGEFVIGRIVAKTGMEVNVARNILTINDRRPDVNWVGGFRFDDPAVGRPLDVRWGTEMLDNVEHTFMVREDFRLTIRKQRMGAGKLFLLSDYRSMMGYDSRSFGPVDAGTCIGRIFMRFKPAEGRESETPPLDHGYFDILD